MIAAVLDPRGPVEAEATLKRMSAAWSDVRVRGCAAIARAGQLADDLELRDATTVEHAARDAQRGAFVALDPHAGVVLARGSIGGRPLYYARTRHEGWVACSRMEPLLEGAKCSFAPDVDRLGSMVLGLADPREHATPFAGISRVGPCQAVRLEEGRATVHVRPRQTRARLEAPVEELASELWKRFENAVRRAIGDAKSVAVMVGGGVDSSSLLAAAVGIARGAPARDVAALALDFDAIGSDRPYLRALADDLGLVPVRLAPRESGRYFKESLVLDAQPYTLTIGPMEQLVFRRARELGAEVLLSGYLADEILAGDLRWLGAEALEGSPVAALRRAVRLRLPWKSTVRDRVERYVVRPILKPLVPRWLLAYNGASGERRAYPWAGPRLREVLAEMRRVASTISPPRSPSERFDGFARSSFLADYADLRGQMEAATGMVRKDPFADEDVLDLLARVRPTVVSHDDLHRGLFRLAIRGRVPELIRLRRDKSYFEPAAGEMAEAAGGLASLGDLWAPRVLERMGLVDSAAFRRAMEPLMRAPGSTADSVELWCPATQVLACESFARGLEAKT